MKTKQESEWISWTASDGYFSIHQPCSITLSLPLWTTQKEYDKIIDDHMKEYHPNEERP